MEIRIYLKQRKDGRQEMFIATECEVFQGERYFNGIQSFKGRWIDYDMSEKDMNRMMKEGRMVQIQ